MNKPLFISFFLLLSLSVCGAAYGQAVSAEDIPVEITIAQISDTVDESEDVGLLPNSSFYFLKELRRSLTKFFAFSADKKAELEIKFADEKAKELKVVQRKNPEDIKGINKAVKNYDEAKELLDARFDRFMRGKSTPEREKLLDSWNDKMKSHKAVFDDLKDQYAGNPDVKGILGDVDRKFDAVLPLTDFKLNKKEFFDELDEVAKSDVYLEEVKEIEDLKADIARGSDKPARTDCPAIEKDIEKVKALLRAGKLFGPDAARQFGILNNELKACQGKTRKPKSATTPSKSSPTSGTSKCDEIKKQMAELGNQFQKQQMSITEYTQKAQELNKQLFACVAESAKIPSLGI